MYYAMSLSDSIAYDIAYPRSQMGFVIVRHVTSKATDYYWKECYTCIRRWYDNPILIVDDSSDPFYLVENLNLVNCSVVYDHEWKGRGELLGYYYFFKMRPFATAVILHDSVFIQKWIPFELEGNMKFLWTFTGQWDHELEPFYYRLCGEMPAYNQIMEQYHTRAYRGCFGLMSVIRWDFLSLLVEDGLFASLKECNERDARSSLERILGFMAFRRDPSISVMFGEIHSYTRWGTTFLEYLSNDSSLDIVKVWTGR